MLPTLNITGLMPQKNLIPNNKIENLSLLILPGGSSAKYKDVTPDDQFKKVISGLSENDNNDGHDNKNDKNNGIDLPANIIFSIFSPIILSLKDQKTPLFQPNTHLLRDTSEPHISSDPIMQVIQNKPEPAEENSQRDPGKALADLLFTKDLPGKQHGREGLPAGRQGTAPRALPVEEATQAPLIEEALLNSAGPKDEKCLPCSHNNHAREGRESHTFTPCKDIAQEGGEVSRRLLLGAKQTGEGGDVKDKPGLDRELDLLSCYKGGEGGDFSKILANIPGHSRYKVAMDSHININDTQTSNEIQNLFLQKTAHLVKQDIDSISLNIDRDDLGKLKLDISIRDNLVKAEIVTEYPRVKEMIESNQGQLRDALSDHGLSISYLSVSVEGGHSESPNYQDIMANSSAAGDSHNIQTSEDDNNLVRFDCYQSDNCISIFA